MIRILEGHVLARLAELPAESVHCVATSPPYYGLRDYDIPPQVWGGNLVCEHDFEVEIVGGDHSKNWTVNGSGDVRFDGERPRKKSLAERGLCRHCNAWRGSLGLEPTLELYLDHMVEVCREIRRVLRKDGTFWLNIGDSYANKQLQMVPHRLALRLQEDGWWVRSEIVWAKDAPMPESCTDRPTSAHEKIFLLTKSARYFYDAEAVKEEAENAGKIAGGNYNATAEADFREVRGGFAQGQVPCKRNLRNVWRLPPAPFPDAHFATFPPELPRRCIMAGTSARGVCPKCRAPWERLLRHKAMVIDRSQRTHSMGRTRSSGTMVEPPESETIGWRPTCGCDAVGVASYVVDGIAVPLPIPATVLDPFLGAGTTALAADQLQRDCIGIELSPKYAEMARRRIAENAPLLTDFAADE